MGAMYFLNKPVARSAHSGVQAKTGTATKYGEDTVRQAAVVCEDALNTSDLFKGGYNICV